MNTIGIDLGTTGCKSVIFGQGGKILSQSYIEYGLIQYDGFVEQDAELWWSLVKRTISECIAACSGGSRDIGALSVSSQGISFVPVDGHGRVLHNAISWLDNRASVQAERIAGEFGESNIFLRTGKRASPCYTLPKIMWLNEEMPGVYRNTWKFLMGLDFITFKLTGRAITDYTMASGTMAFDISARRWDKELIEACGVDVDKLPDVGCAGDFIGEIANPAAVGTGLPEGIRVYLGAQDQKCAAFGAGIQPGFAAVSLGTATAVSTVCPKPVFDEEMRLPCFCVGKDRWVLESVIGTSGASLKWLRDTLFGGISYSDLTEYAAHSAPGANGLRFYPHFQGATSPYWVSGASGAFQGITLATSRYDIVRAVLEGIAYQISVNVGLHEKVDGNVIRELRLFGGGANSALWCGIIADVTGKSVVVPYTIETANLGAAMLAGLGGGDAAGMPPPQARFEPRENARVYRDLIQDYLAAQDRILY